MDRPTVKRKRGRPKKIEQPSEWKPKGGIPSRNWNNRGRDFTEEENSTYGKGKPLASHPEAKGFRDPTVEDDFESIKNQIPNMDLMNTGVFEATLSKKGSAREYSADQRVLAATAFALSGNYLTAAIKSSVNYNVVLRWKKEPWWQNVINEIRRTKCEEFDMKCTALIDNLLEHMVDRLVNGEEVVLRDGEKVKKSVDLNKLTNTLNVLFDKRALGRGEVTSRTEKVDTAKVLKDLGQEFENVVEREG